MPWERLKSDLISANKLPTFFGESIDGKIGASVTTPKLQEWRRLLKPNDPDGIIYQPLLVDSLLRDVSALLDRILLYRREARELEIQAVRAATDYQLQTYQSEIDLSLQITQLRADRKSAEKRTHEAASQSFGADGPMERGFARLSVGRADELMLELDGVETEINLLQRRHALSKSYRDSYAARHQQAGNAHNYEERAQLVMRLLTEDMLEAYLKAEAIREGWQLIYSEEPGELPPIDGTNFVDDLVLWCRQMIRVYEIRSASETEYDRIVALVQPTRAGAPPLVLPDDFARALAATSDGVTPFQLSFRLSSEDFPAPATRIRGIGLSFGSKTNIIAASGSDRGATADGYVRLDATVTTPQQSLGRSPFTRPAVRFGTVGVLAQGEPLAFTNGTECQNLNPVGLWKISIEPLVIYKDGQARTLASGVEEPMRDLKLHLRLRSLPVRA